VVPNNTSLGKEIMMDFEDVTDEIYFGEMKMMFATDGWKLLMLELEEAAELYGNIQDITSFDQLNFNKGQLAQIARLLNFEDTIKRAEEEEAEVDVD
jgi:hypothetical protein